ncbi:MAG: hypothetical protein ABMA64_03605 [Myxococcota bacterium]
MRTVGTLALLPLAGCWSYWDLREGEELEIGCAGYLYNWYPDADGDRWGDPGSVPTPSCAPDEANGLTASNDLDCDDNDATITGKTAAICPSQMAGGLASCVRGVRQGQSEYVLTCEDTPMIPFAQGEQDCLAWAGWETPESVELDPEGHHGLASLDTDFEYNTLVAWLDEQVGSIPTAVWVDVRWSGDLQTGGWAWPDGTAPTFVPACGGIEASPADFWPDLVPGLPESDAALTEHLDEVRLALVFDGSGWCRGVPSTIGLEPREAHVLCERPSPNLAQFGDDPIVDDGKGTPGPGQ